MNTQHSTTGTVNFGAYKLTFVTSEECNFITLYDASVDDEITRDYGTMNETLETITLLLTSETARGEFLNS